MFPWVTYLWGNEQMQGKCFFAQYKKTFIHL